MEKLPCEGQILPPETRVTDLSDPSRVLVEMSYRSSPCEDPMVTIMRLRLTSGLSGQQIRTNHQAIRLDEPNYQVVLVKPLVLTVGQPVSTIDTH